MTSLTLNTTNATTYNTSINTANNVPTMTSLEIVEFINNHRQANGNETVLAHSDFLKKVPEVLGHLVAGNFSSIYKDSLNRDKPCYVFPKREACLMGMSYSYDLQAEIYDRMTAMEQYILMQNRPSYMIEDPIERAKKWIEEATVKQEIAAKLFEKEQVILEMKPTVDAYDLIAGKKGSLSFQEAYRYLGGIKLKEMKAWLLDKKWIFTDRHNRVMPSNTYLVNGYLKQKTTQYEPQIRITYKGLAAIARQMKIKLNAEDFN